jgi:glycosyltransferase involved in cell wall biosynthesis
VQQVLRTGSLAGAARIRRDAGPLIAWADLVHVHSNGLLPEVMSWLAHRAGRPVVLTLYGTEIWHYQVRRWPDLFTRAYRDAEAVTLYSERLLARARELGLARGAAHVVYPPVSPTFRRHDAQAQREVRQRLGLSADRLIVNVKRLHPLAGQRFLIEALPGIVREHPGVHLVICGTGTLLPDLQALARARNVERSVTFAGLVDNASVARYCAAADLFVLPSILEALPTVAVEALATGTPVISADNPGGVELHGVFGDDVQVVPKESPDALAAAVSGFLRAPRRTLPATDGAVEARFRPAAVARQYWAIYDAARRSS